MMTSKFPPDRIDTALIILAAGGSERMGKIKQLLPWKNTTILGNIIEQAIRTGIKDIYVVLGSQREIIHKEISRYKISVIYNPNWQKGMGTSVSKAMKILLRENLYSSVLFVLADQPLITSQDLNSLLKNFKKTHKGIVSTKINSHSGVPAIFNKKYFIELAGLKDDYGARYIISKNYIDNLTVDLNDHYIDVDTINTYNRLYSIHHKDPE